MLELLKCDTFWSAISALATLAGVVVIVIAIRQLRFEAWLKAQEIWVNPEFTKNRGKIFARLDNLNQPWKPEEEEIGYEVSRKMDEFAHLAPYLGNRKILRDWGDPIAKAWLILEPLVQKERAKTSWDNKWRAFQKLGTKSLKARPYLKKNLQITKK
jgi:hypothetical protein